MFAMFQIILVIDFGHSWSLSWVNKMQHGYTKLWYAAMTMVTFVLFAMSGCAAASFYLFFTHPPDVKKCHANVFYIAFISIQCFVASIVSVMPTIQRELAGAGLLQSSVVMYTYVRYRVLFVFENVISSFQILGLFLFYSDFSLYHTLHFSVHVF